MGCFLYGTAGRLASLTDTVTEQPAPDHAPHLTEIILFMEHHTHVLLIDVPVKQTKVFNDLNMISMCLYEMHKSYDSRYGRTSAHPARARSSDWRPCCPSFRHAGIPQERQ